MDVTHSLPDISISARSDTKSEKKREKADCCCLLVHETHITSHYKAYFSYCFSPLPYLTQNLLLGQVFKNEGPDLIHQKVQERVLNFAGFFFLGFFLCCFFLLLVVATSIINVSSFWVNE